MELEERTSPDLQVDVTFEDRIYKVGDAIDATVRLTPRKNMSIRAARLSLVCRERFTVWSRPTVYDRNVSRGGTAAYGSSGERVEERELDTVTLWKDLTLKTATEASRRETVRLKDARPVHAEEAKELRLDGIAAWGFEWLLVVDIDTRLGWDIQAHHKVKVLFE